MKKSTTLIEQACFSLPEFKQVYEKLQRHVELLGKSESTLNNYARCLSTMALHIKCNPLDSLSSFARNRCPFCSGFYSQTSFS